MDIDKRPYIQEDITLADLEVASQLQAAARDPRLQAAVRLCQQYDMKHDDIGSHQVTIDDELQSVVDGYGIPQAYISQLLNMCEIGLSEDQN